MAKRRRITVSQIEKMQKQGRGHGKGYGYKPWITVRDVPSKGFAHRIKGWKTGRVHHLLSNLELYFFYLLEWSQNVVDIREKYPLLPIESTLEISERFGLKHEWKNHEPLVMVTDFLVDIKTSTGNKLMAYSITPEQKKAYRTFLEKTFIERTFWKEQGISFNVVTNKDIPMNLVKNVEWLHDSRELRFAPGITFSDIGEIEPFLFNEITKPKQSLAEGCKKVDQYFGLSPGISLWIVRHLIANQLWKTDMNQLIDTKKAVEIQRDIKLYTLFLEGREDYDISS
jgi:hypothetical protein